MSEQHTLTWPTTADKPMYADASTLALLARCLAGEQAAFATLYDEYAAMIYRLAYSLLQQKEDSEEVLQDSFAYAFRRLRHYDPHKSSFKTWIYQIAISRSRNKRRRKWLPTYSLSQMINQDVTDNDSPTPDDMLALSDKQRVVWGALSRLSPKLRETAVLRYYEAMTYNEIGLILGIPPKTAESRMRLAHKALRKQLEGEDIL